MQLFPPPNQVDEMAYRCKYFTIFAQQLSTFQHLVKSRLTSGPIPIGVLCCQERMDWQCKGFCELLLSVSGQLQFQDWAASPLIHNDKIPDSTTLKATEIEIQTTSVHPTLHL